MKKLLLIFLTLSYLSSFSQITRGSFVIRLFSKVYGTSANVNNYPASQFHSPFIDLQQTSGFKEFATLFAYLEYGDGIPVIDRSMTHFNANGYYYRDEVVRMILEAFDVAPATSGTLPYTDYTLASASQDNYWYVVKAYQLGLLPTGTIFNPNSFASITYATNLMSGVRLIYGRPSSTILSDITNYYIPFVSDPSSFGQTKGIEHGVFSHYAKNSFVIPDRKMNLNFSHFYSNFMVEMPSDFYKIKPLSRGWSHTYNSYIVREDNVGTTSTDYYYIIWPDGTIHVYDEDANQYDTKGVYDDFYDSSSRHIRITKKDFTQYHYRQIDNSREIYYLEKIIDKNGNKIEIDYEMAHELDTRRIEYVYAPSGKRLEFDYKSGTDLIEEIHDPMGRKIEFDYSGVTSTGYYRTPVLVAFDDAKNQKTRYSYKALDPYSAYLLKRIDLPRGNKITADYDNNGKLKEYKINNMNPVDVDVDYDYVTNTFESTVETTLPAGNLFTQDYKFNINGQVIDYNDNNDYVQVSYPTIGPNTTLPYNIFSKGVDIDFTYDNKGNVLEIDFDNGFAYDDYWYNSDNTLRRHRNRNGHSTYYYYDANKNLVQIQDPANQITNITYDPFGQITSITKPEGQVTNFTHEYDGVVSRIDRAMGQYFSFAYDSVNRQIMSNNNGLIDSTFYDHNDNIIKKINSGGFATTYNYDANDNLTGITNANNVSTILQYDNEDRLISEQFGTLLTQYQFNSDNQLTRMIKPSGSIIDFDYDSDGRIDETGTVTDVDYNGDNLIEKISTSAGNTYLYYDIKNWIEKVKTVHNTEVKYWYDKMGNITQIKYPVINGNLFYVKYTYDSRNRMSKVEMKINGTYYDVAQYYYTNNGNLSYVRYPHNLDKFIIRDSLERKVQYTYNNRMLSQMLFYDSVLLDNRNNVIKNRKYYAIPGTPYVSGTVGSLTNTYNQNNHITQNNGQGVTVNADGNTTQQNISGGNPYQYFFNKDDQLWQIHQSAGRCLPYTYEYNGFGNQTSMVKRPSGSLPNIYQYTWDIMSQNMIFETKDGTNPLYHIYGVTGMEITVTDIVAGVPKFIVRMDDLRGNIVANIEDDSTKITEFLKYDEFGRFRGFSSHTGTGCDAIPREYKYCFMGKYGVRLEHGLHLYNVKARYYDANLGRFISEDPVWSTNLYPYADNNPMSKNDPTGRIPVETLLDAASIGYSGYELYSDPSWINAGYFLWDIGATALPYIPGSYVAKGAKGLSKVPGDNLIALGRGSTGRNIAKTLTEKRAMKEIIGNPRLGKVVMTDLSDPRWKGWSKMRYVQRNADGTKTTIHYVGKFENGVLKYVDDFKFK